MRLLQVTGYGESKSGLFRLLAQGWDRGLASDAERRLRSFVPAPILRRRRSLRRQPSPDVEVVADRVAAALAGILAEIERGARLLYDGLPVHSLGEDQLCKAVMVHLGRPCIADAERLLRDLASAAALDMVALRRSPPSLVRRLERRAAEIQTAVKTSRDYWLEMATVLAEQREARPAHLRVVRSSQCLHHGRRRLAARGWQPRAYDPDTKLACAGLVRGVVSRDRRALFSDITVGPASAGAAVRVAVRSPQAHASAPPGRLRGEKFQLLMLACVASRRHRRRTRISTTTPASAQRHANR